MAQQLRVCPALTEDPVQLTVPMSAGRHPPVAPALGAPKSFSGYVVAQTYHTCFVCINNKISTK